MGLIESMRSVADPQTKAREVHEIVTGLQRTRLRLYLDERTVEDQFVQHRGPLDEMSTGGQISIDAGGSYLGFVSGRAGRTATAAEGMVVTPFVKTLLIEDAARDEDELVDLSIAEPRDGPLLFFLGAGRIFTAREPVVDVPEFELNANQALAVEKERQIQAAVGDTLVWVGRGRATTLAAIADAAHSELGTVMSYRQTPPHGLLAIWEGELQGVVLLKLLFLWRESQADAPPRHDAGRPASARL